MKVAEPQVETLLILQPGLKTCAVAVVKLAQKVR
jgi:hypothetical protein